MAVNKVFGVCMEGDRVPVLIATELADAAGLAARIQNHRNKKSRIEPFAVVPWDEYEALLARLAAEGTT